MQLGGDHRPLCQLLTYEDIRWTPLTLRRTPALKEGSERGPDLGNIAEDPSPPGPPAHTHPHIHTRTHPPSPTHGYVQSDSETHRVCGGTCTHADTQSRAR